MAAVENQREEPRAPAGTVVELNKPARRARKRRSWLRLLLLVVIPVIAIAGAGWMYLTGGRYVSTDNAYVRAAIMNVTNDISGIVNEVDVHENQRVAKDDVLFK